MKARTLMVQGTSSHAGKSLIVTALCRIFAKKGYKVAPFKSQNMALNSYVTKDGSEMGRAQAVQAEAAGLKPIAQMNPILLKPNANHQAQVIVLGKPTGLKRAREYYELQSSLWPAVRDSFHFLQTHFDLILIEGAGSPAEINLKKQDIANMSVAKLAQAPVMLVGDIERGGVFASLIGTLKLLPKSQRERVKGLIINKFRGDLSLLKPGIEFLTTKTKLPVLGVIPYVEDLEIEAEDSLSLPTRGKEEQSLGRINIGVVRLPHLANFTDFDPLRLEPEVNLKYIFWPDHLDQFDLLILPGTKSTISDFLWLKEKGLAEKLVRFAKEGRPIMGICGGFQMLGRRIFDPKKVEGGGKEASGLGLLEIETLFGGLKVVRQVQAEVIGKGSLLGSLKEQKISGYEIHHGILKKDKNLKPAFQIMSPNGKKSEGAVSDSGLILGTYLHGLFENDHFRQGLINFLRKRKGLPPLKLKGLNFKQFKEEHFNKLAHLLEKNLDLSSIYQIIEGDKSGTPSSFSLSSGPLVR